MFKKLHIGIICQEFVRQANYGRYSTFFQSSLFFLNYSFYPYQQYGRKKTGDLSHRLILQTLSGVAGKDLEVVGVMRAHRIF